MKQKLYVLQSAIPYTNLGVDYHTYFIVFPGGNHPYSYIMSEAGWIYNLYPALSQIYDIVEFDSSANPRANIWGLIQLHKEQEQLINS